MASNSEVGPSSRFQDKHRASPNPDKILYPTGLNPFGDEIGSDEYPDQLNPFNDDTGTERQDDYDHSLNPFADDEHSEDELLDASNPFADKQDDDHEDDHEDGGALDADAGAAAPECADAENTCVEDSGAEDASAESINEEVPDEKITHLSEMESLNEVPRESVSLAPSPRPRSVWNSAQISSLHSAATPTSSPSPSPTPSNSLAAETNDCSLTNSQSSISEFRPVPMPRKKSLIKKTGTLAPQNNRAAHSTSSLPRVTAEEDSKSSDTKTDERSLDRRTIQKKRAAPPLPVNFKRQVDGCLAEIETEIEDIGLKLLNIEQESLDCRLKLQEKKKKKKRLTLKRALTMEPQPEDEAAKRLAALMRQKSQLARRQKELMYKKREHILDLHYSDIEYQLRLITNKQTHLRTEEDDAREQQLLKKLVEIVEEKNDIVENQIRDTYTTT